MVGFCYALRVEQGCIDNETQASLLICGPHGLNIEIRNQERLLFSRQLVRTKTVFPPSFDDEIEPSI